MRWGVEVGWQAWRMPCYTFFKLNKKTYHMKLNLKIVICKGYNGGRSMMWMSSTINGKKQEGKWLIVERNVQRWTKAINALPKGSF